MFFVGLGDYHINIERVAARVRNGGHDIPTEDIIRRHTTSIQNLPSNVYLIDHLIVIDNSESDGEIVLEAGYGVLKYQNDPLPVWVQSIEQYLRK
ncbi:hypothetical protein D3C77_378620 [compost metagenome]